MPLKLPFLYCGHYGSPFERRSWSIKDDFDDRDKKDKESMKVKYMGNVITAWAKGDGCAERALSQLWSHHSLRPSSVLAMRLSVGPLGLRACTEEHGITLYWAHRITFCATDLRYPKLCTWIYRCYRHENGIMRHELRCHAVLCPSQSKAENMVREIEGGRQNALVNLKRHRWMRKEAKLQTTWPNMLLLRDSSHAKTTSPLNVIEECSAGEDEENDDFILKKPQTSKN